MSRLDGAPGRVALGIPAVRPDHAAHIRREVTDVATVVAKLGLGEGAKRQPGGASVRCPWHDEKTPSCSITIGPDGTIRAKCFGCDAGGDVLSLVAAVRGLDTRRQHFVDVLKAAAETFGLWSVVMNLELTGGQTPNRQTPSTPIAPKRVSAPPPPALPVVEPAVYDELASALLELCPIAGEPDARAYLEARGVYADAEARGFGALPAAMGPQLEAVAPLAARFGADTLVRAGLVKPAPGGLWAPSHRLIIPWRDAAGRILSLQRRVIGPSAKDGPPKYLFPKGVAMPSEPFGAELFDDALERDGVAVEVAFTESALDALAMAALCRRHRHRRIVLGLPSASTWRSEWARYAAGHRAIVATDADQAGEKIAARIIADLKTAGVTSIVRNKPVEGKDWSDVTSV